MRSAFTISRPPVCPACSRRDDHVGMPRSHRTWTRPSLRPRSVSPRKYFTTVTSSRCPRRRAPAGGRRRRRPPGRSEACRIAGLARPIASIPALRQPRAALRQFSAPPSTPSSSRVRMPRGERPSGRVRARGSKSPRGLAVHAQSHAASRPLKPLFPHTATLLIAITPIGRQMRAAAAVNDPRRSAGHCARRQTRRTRRCDDADQD